MGETMILRRGTELWLNGNYPVIVTQDIPVPYWCDRSEINVPVTDIIAYGSDEDEQERTWLVKAKELSFTRYEKKEA